MDGIMSFSKPLLTSEQFSELLENGSDAIIWMALEEATQNDSVLSQVFRLSRHRGWSQHRTLMVCAYVMAQRHDHMMKLEMDRLNCEIPKMYLCAGCEKKLAIQDPETRVWRLKTPEERK